MWYVKLGITVFVAFIIQTTLLQNFEVFGIIPNLLVVLVTCFSLIENNMVVSSVFGLICGVLLDVANRGVFGVSGLLCMLLALLCTFAGEKFFKGKFWVSMLFIFVAGNIYELVYYFLMLGMWQSGGHFISSLLYVVLPTAIYNVIVAVPVFFIVKRIRPAQ